MDMDALDENSQNYCDMALQILTAYLSDDGSINFDLAGKVMQSLYDDPEVNGPGFLPGLFFAAVIHMSLMLDILSVTNEISQKEALSRYALSYAASRHYIAKMPQIHPSVVNEIVEHLKDF